MSVVLKNGTEIKIEGANDAHWSFQKLAEGASNNSLVLVVELKEANVVATRGRFLGDEIVGYTVDPR
ncbi:MAG: hypothetical protein HYX53_00220 [Chloroflexi bacterium]|nr:hypothetical protein [Chloroflexota bacterium]